MTDEDDKGLVTFTGYEIYQSQLTLAFLALFKAGLADAVVAKVFVLHGDKVPYMSPKGKIMWVPREDDWDHSQILHALRADGVEVKVVKVDFGPRVHVVYGYGGEDA